MSVSNNFVGIDSSQDKYCTVDCNYKWKEFDELVKKFYFFRDTTSVTSPVELEKSLKGGGIYEWGRSYCIPNKMKRN